MAEEKKILGLVVNPIAGMGGRVGLKGSDGSKTLARARELGAVPTSPARAIEALEALRPLRDGLDLVTYPAHMGESEARQAGFEPKVLGRIDPEETTAADTRQAVKDMAALKPALILFAGGDGTARDVCQVIENDGVVVGVPAGVKIHSGVFAITPTRAGRLAAEYLGGRIRTVQEQEVMDIDEEAFRQGRVSARLYGYLKTPSDRRYTQGAKAASAGGRAEALAMRAIAEEIVAAMSPDQLYVIGSGTTPRAIMEQLGLPNTLLGVDVVENGRLVAADVNESQLLNLLAGRRASIVVTPIGGQGYIFGRGNQQLSPAVIEAVGLKNIIVVSTKSKLISLKRRPLLVDTGDEALNQALRGYVRVVTGRREEMIYRVA